MKLRLDATGRALIGIYGPGVVMSLGHGMVVPTIPQLATSFDMSMGLAAQLVTASMLGRVLTVLPIGQVLDRHGHRPLLIGGPLLVAAASALTAVAPSFWLLLLAQFLVGIGSSAWHSALELAALDVVRPEQRGRMMSGFMGMHAVGTALGPVFGGLLTDVAGFRAVFAVYALFSLATLAMFVRIRSAGTVHHRAQTRLFDIGRVSEVEPYFRTTYVVLIVNTAVAMMRGALVASLIPLYIGLHLGHSSTEVGTWFGIYGLVNVLMIAPTGILMDARGRKSVVMPSTYLAALLFFVFPLATGNLQLFGLAVLAGLANGLASGTMATYTYDVIPEHARARLQALRRLCADVGAISGPILGGAIADVASPAAAFWAFAPIQLVAGLLITFLARESLPLVRERAREAASKSIA
jgi:MFS family permease